MKTRGGKFLLLLGAVLAAMAFIVVYVVMSGRLSTSANDPSANAATAVEPVLVSVAVVNRDLPAYTMLDSTNVATIDIEVSTQPSGTTTSPATVFGKMTLAPLAKGQMIQTNQLTETGFSSILAKGERAFALAVPEKSTFGNVVMENDYVDLLWTVVIAYDRPKPPTADGKIEYEVGVYSSTKTLLQNLHVMRVINLAQDAPTGQRSQATSEEAAATTGPAPSAASMYNENAPFRSVLVLGVTDQQAEVIAYARQNGVIDLTLRSSAPQKDEAGVVLKDEQGNDLRGDKEVEKTTGVTLEMLIQQYGVIPPAVVGR